MAYSVYLHENGENYEFTSEKQIDVFVEVVESLIREHGLLSEISLPYVPGETKAALNSEPVNGDSSEMHSYREVDDVFLNSNYSKKEKQTVLEHFALECGLEIFFLGWD